jgi:hypothetical protein
MASMAIVVGMAGAVSAGVLTFLLVHGSGFYPLGLAGLTVIGLLIALASAALAYFTFVPPKNVRSGRRI